MKMEIYIMERSIGRRTGTLREDTGGIKTLLVGENGNNKQS